MVDESATHVANYMLESILKDLSFLKENNFLPQQTYRDVVAILPSRITTPTNAETIKPPLPTRKSTNGSNHNLTAPVPQPREMSNNATFPKLPTRRTPEWQAPSPPPTQQQQPVMVMPTVTKNILHSEPEKSTPPPPAYTQKPNNESSSLATAEALYDYHGEDPSTDLSFKQGDIIEVTEYGN
jgi:hypothetical protein